VATDDAITLEGRIERRLVERGSKSEHHAVVLVLPDGSVHRLRRIGGNPFRDPHLDALEGQSVCLRGWLRAGYFIVEIA
jgi:hypothetical protein